MSDEHLDEPATKRDLRDEIAGVRGEIAGVRGEITEIRGEITEMRSDITNLRAATTGLQFDLKMVESRLRADSVALEQRLMIELGRLVTSFGEDVGARIGVIVDKYDGQLRDVRGDLDAHRKDFSMHKRPAARPPKRATRRGPAR